jgi:hypothetical protein
MDESKEVGADALNDSAGEEKILPADDVVDGADAEGDEGVKEEGAVDEENLDQ